MTATALPPASASTVWLDSFAAVVTPELAQPAPLKDPVEWASKRLSLSLWSKQRDIVASVRDHRRTAVRSCHDAGKSLTAAVIAAWWIDTHPEGEAIVVSTAPTYDQVHNILWEEIRKQHRKGGLAGVVGQSDQWKLDDGTLVGFGRKPADTDEHGFVGIHRRYVLVILDEACGIPDSLWTGVEAITTNADCRILAIGNPTDPGTEFGKVCKPGSGWSVIGISAFETPNFTDEYVPASLGPLLLSPEWVEDMRKSWGEDSPFWKARVLGEFPEVGTDTLISPKLIEAAQARTLEPRLPERLSADIARFGSDKTIIMRGTGPVARKVGEYSKQSTTETTGQVVVAARDIVGLEDIRVDGVGVGGGVVDQLAEQGWPVIDMQAGGAAMDNTRFLNARAEWYWGLRERFQQGDVDLDPEADELASQLGSLRYKYTSRGQVQIESKDDMKKRGMPSPDEADALMMLFAHVPVVPDGMQQFEEYDEVDARGYYASPV